MTSLVATREALERFTEELPAAGLKPGRLRRHAIGTQAMITQALSTERPATIWIDHNLATLVSEALEEPALQRPALTFFRGIRRRLKQALANDPDGLAPALALALGGARSSDDPQTEEEAALVLKALANPHAGPRLLNAAVHLLARAARKKGGAAAKLFQSARGDFETLVAALKKRLPNHPDVALDEIRLKLLAAREAETEARVTWLEACRAGLGDFEKRFGESRASRRLRAEVIGLRARSPKPGKELVKDALALFDHGLKSGTLDPKTAERLARALGRSKQLARDQALDLAARIKAFAGDDGGPWRHTMAHLMEQGGDEGGLSRLWEEVILADPNDKNAAAGLADRLLSNLRGGLKPPFDNQVLDHVLNAVPPGKMARWSAQDLKALFDVVREGFGEERLLTFLEERVLKVREHRAKRSLWDEALALCQDPKRRLALARRAVKEGKHERARIALVEDAIASGEGLDEAEKLLKPLLQAKGPIAAEAQTLQRKLLKHPDLNRNHYGRLVAFEQDLGLGTSKTFKLRVVFTSKNYLLADLVGRSAPTFYEHKYLRTMLRDKDLPKGITLDLLRKGDILHAPIRGTDADPKRDKASLRVYWISDPAQVTSEKDAAALKGRAREAERALGIGSGKLLALKVFIDKRRKDLTARFAKKGVQGRIAVTPEQLPEGLSPDALGDGRRLWGIVVRSDEGQLTIDGKLSPSAPDEPVSEANAPSKPEQSAAKDDATATATEAADAKPEPTPSEDTPATEEPADAKPEPEPAPSDAPDEPPTESEPPPADEPEPSAETAAPTAPSGDTPPREEG